MPTDLNALDMLARLSEEEAAHPTIGKGNHGFDLPTDINALDMLARLSEAEIEEAIETGKVTREVARR